MLTLVFAVWWYACMPVLSGFGTVLLLAEVFQLAKRLGWIMIWSQAEMDGPSHLYLLPWLTTCNQISRTMHSTGSQLPSWRTTCPEHFSHWCKCTAQFKSVLKFNKAYIACLLKKIARIGFLARLPFFLATRFCPRTLPAPASTVQNC